MKKHEHDLLATELRIQRNMPESVLALMATELGPDEIVVQRLNGQERVFLFESLDDAYDGVSSVAGQLGFEPKVVRVRTADLPFRRARYKPADSAPFNISRISVPR
jgi:hypothetical protein